MSFKCDSSCEVCKIIHSPPPLDCPALGLSRAAPYLATLLGPTASHVQGSMLLLLLNFEQGRATQIVDVLRAECPPAQRGDVTMADVSLGTAFGPINLEETKSQVDAGPVEIED